MGLLVIFVSACSSGKIIPLDRGTYYLSESNARLGMGPPSAETIASVYKKSTEFCKKDGKEVERINNIYTDSGFGKTANFALEFRCINKDKAIDTYKSNTTIVTDKNTPPVKHKISSSDRLKELKEMYKTELITEEEYKAKRKQVIDNY